MLQQFHGDPSAEILKLVEEESVQGGNEGSRQAIHFLGGGLSAARPRQTGIVRRVLGNE